MTNIIERMLFKPKQYALLDAAKFGQVQTRTGYLLNSHGCFSTTEFSVQTDMGSVCATFAQQGSYALKPNDFYTVSVITPDNKSMSEYNGIFARTMYNKLKQRYEKRNIHVR